MVDGDANPWQRLTTGHRFLLGALVLGALGVLGPWIQLGDNIQQLLEDLEARGYETDLKGYEIGAGIVLLVASGFTAVVLLVTKGIKAKTVTGAIVMGLTALILWANVINAYRDPTVGEWLRTDVVRFGWGIWVSVAAATLAFGLALAGHWWGRPAMPQPTSDGSPPPTP